MKNKIGYILVVIVIIIAVIATTYSWFTWKKDENRRIGLNITTSGPKSECIVYSTSYKSGSKNLVPVSSREKGYITNINISKNCNSDIYVDFKLKIKDLAPTLKKEAFKYALVKNNDTIGIGDFKDAKKEDTINVASGEEITSDLKNYEFYLWIDESSNSNLQIQNQKYEFDLSINVTDE